MLLIACRGRNQLFGFAYGGPFGHFMHKLLDTIFKGKTDKKTVAKKVDSSVSSLWLILFAFDCKRSNFRVVLFSGAAGTVDCFSLEPFAVLVLLRIGC